MAVMGVAGGVGAVDHGDSQDGSEVVAGPLTACAVVDDRPSWVELVVVEIVAVVVGVASADVAGDLASTPVAWLEVGLAQCASYFRVAFGSSPLHGVDLAACVAVAADGRPDNNCCIPCWVRFDDDYYGDMLFGIVDK